MCGVIGLHLRNPELHPRLGQLLTGMLCEMSNRGSDSAGVAVYGNPSWIPQGRSGVSVLQVPDAPTAAETAISAELGIPVTVSTLGETMLVTADDTAEALYAAVTAAYPHALIAGFGADVTVLKGVGHPRPLARGDQGDLAAVDHGQLALPVGGHQHPHPRAGPPATDLVAEPLQHFHLSIPGK